MTNEEIDELIELIEKRPIAGFKKFESLTPAERALVTARTELRATEAQQKSRQKIGQMFEKMGSGWHYG